MFEFWNDFLHDADVFLSTVIILVFVTAVVGWAVWMEKP